MPLYLDDFEPPDVPDDYLRALLRIANPPATSRSTPRLRPISCERF